MNVTNKPNIPTTPTESTQAAASSQAVPQQNTATQATGQLDGASLQSLMQGLDGVSSSDLNNLLQLLLAGGDSYGDLSANPDNSSTALPSAYSTLSPADAYQAYLNNSSIASSYDTSQASASDFSDLIKSLGLGDALKGTSSTSESDMINQLTSQLPDTQEYMNQATTKMNAEESKTQALQQFEQEFTQFKEMLELLNQISSSLNQLNESIIQNIR